MNRAIGKSGIKILGIMSLLLAVTGCATFRQIPSLVEEVSICDVITACKELSGKEVLISGKSSGSYGKNIFSLQCLHDPNKSVMVDTSGKDVMPVENSNREVKVFGKVRVMEDRKVIIIAEAAEVGGVILNSDEMPKGSPHSGAGGCH